MCPAGGFGPFQLQWCTWFTSRCNGSGDRLYQNGVWDKISFFILEIALQSMFAVYHYFWMECYVIPVWKLVRQFVFDTSNYEGLFKSWNHSPFAIFS